MKRAIHREATLAASEFWESVGTRPLPESAIETRVRFRPLTLAILRRARLDGFYRFVTVREREWRVLWSDVTFAGSVRDPGRLGGPCARGILGDVLIRVRP